jgi:hypothetical protein
MNTQKIIEIERAAVIKHLMPDRCKVYPRKNGSTIVHGIAIPAGANTPRLWRGLDEVPCRADLSRAFRPDKLKTQATEVDEYNLELPFDFVFEPTDFIVITKDGVENRLEIRKIKNISNWDVSIECVIDQVGTTIDYP